MINKVTITGADNTVDPRDLAGLSAKYPFVEWGILVSRKQFGNPRFPTKEWISQLANMYWNKELGKNLRLSAHLCGEYVTEFLLGVPSVAVELEYRWNIFYRVQLNVRGKKRRIDPDFFDLLSDYEKDFIIQYGSENDYLVKEAHDRGTPVSILYDKSGGQGILPDRWPAPMVWCQSGYAGGLNPDNLESQLQAISETTGQYIAWVDMETGVRSHDGTRFDLDAVVKCLEISRNFLLK